MQISQAVRAATGTVLAATVLMLSAGPASAQTDPAKLEPVPAEEAKPIEEAKPREATGRLQQMTKETAAITAGDQAWVALNWTSVKGAVDDVKIVAYPNDGITVTYPENTADHSGPMNGYAIEDGELDFTALRIAVPYGFEKLTELVVVASYTSNGTTVEEKFAFSVPVVAYDGEDLQLVSEAVEASSKEPGWVELSFRGLAPQLDKFTLTATGPEGLSIEYPSGDNASLQQNAELEDGETDVARLYLDTTKLGPGSVPLDITVIYVKGGEERKFGATVKLIVG